MADDLEELQRQALLREVDEEVRNDELKALWKKYRFYIISAAILAILGAFVFEGIKYYKQEVSARDSVAFTRALNAAVAGDVTSSMIDLDAVMKDKATGYAELAALRSVSLLEKAGQNEEAMALLYEIRGTKDFSAPARNVATVAIAQRLMDAENPDYAEVEKLLAPLAAEGSAWKDIAREILEAIPD